MTSDDTADTDIGYPPCDKCPARSGGTCRMVTAANLTAAYKAGCQAPAARAAASASQAANRAKNRSEGRTAGVPAGGPAGGPWSATASDPGPVREATGDPCPVCGQPAYWTRGRAGQECDNGHWQLAPNTASRVSQAKAVARRTADEIPKRATVADIMLIDRERERITDLCKAQITYLDTSQLIDISNQFFNGGLWGWNETLAKQYRSDFNSLDNQASRADTLDLLAEIEREFRRVNDAGLSILISTIQQSSRDFANWLNNRFRETGRRFGTNNIGPLWVRELEQIALPDSPKVLAGEVIPNYQPCDVCRQPGQSYTMANGQIRVRCPNHNSNTPLAITSGRTNTPLAIVTADDDEYDDDEYDDDYYYGNETGPSNGTLIIVGLIVAGVAAWWIYQTWTHNGYKLCDYPHKTRPGLARLEYKYTSGLSSINSCSGSKCQKLVAAQIEAQMQDGYTAWPIEYNLTDDDGNNAMDINGTRNPLFKGVKI